MPSCSFIRERKREIMTTLIVTEKPTACQKISAILSNKKHRKLQKPGSKVTFYESVIDGEKVIVVSGIGHLFQATRKHKIKGDPWQYPFWDVEWAPSHELKRSLRRNEDFVTYIKELAREADNFINACDYDLEGATIGYCILKYCCGPEAVEKAKRMKFSSMTEKEILNSFNNLLPSLNFELVEAGLTRHEVDLLYGINLTAALTSSIINSGVLKFKILSTGRVQGPTLKFVFERENEVQTHVPKPYWTINASTKINGSSLTLDYSKSKIWKLTEVNEILDHCKGKNGIIKDIKKQQRKSNPPEPLNLSVLQSQSYNHLGYTPSQTLRIAERLYLSGLISYPRTSSQIIPEDIDLQSIVSGIKENAKYSKYIDKILKKGPLVPTKGKKTDPAHPPILPTGEKPTRKLSSTEERLLELITRRFLAIFGDPAVIQSIKTVVGVNSHSFNLTGRRIIEPGWMEIYHYSQTKEIILPDLKIGQTLSLKFSTEEKFTSGPSRFNANSLRKVMEENEIGTKATRADIIDKLSKRGYVGGRQIYLYDLGIALIEVLEKYCNEINSIEMTRTLEKDMEAIEQGKLNREDILEKVRAYLGLVLEKFKENEKNIGVELAESIKSTWERQRIIGKCNVCEGNLVVIRSLGTKKRFIGCTNYQVCAKCDQPKEACVCKCEVCGEPKGSCECKEGPEDEPDRKHYYPKCSNSFPVAQRGSITPLDNKFCPYCEQEFGVKYPMFQLRLPNSKRPFYACVNWTQHPKSKKAKKTKETEGKAEEVKEETPDKSKKVKKTKKAKKAKAKKKTKKKKTAKKKKKSSKTKKAKKKTKK